MLIFIVEVRPFHQRRIVFPKLVTVYYLKKIIIKNTSEYSAGVTCLGRVLIYNRVQAISHRASHRVENLGHEFSIRVCAHCSSTLQTFITLYKSCKELLGQYQYLSSGFKMQDPWFYKLPTVLPFEKEYCSAYHKLTENSVPYRTRISR